MARKIGQITDADVYINEVDVAGRVTDLNPGDIGHTVVKHAALGMVGVLELPGRPVEAIRGKITFQWLDEEISRQMMNPTRVNKLQLHSHVDIFGPEGVDLDQSHTLVTHLGFQVIKTSGWNQKLGTPMGVAHDITISSFSQKVYGQETPIILFDGWNQIYEINGERVWRR